MMEVEMMVYVAGRFQSKPPKERFGKIRQGMKRQMISVDRLPALFEGFAWSPVSLNDAKEFETAQIIATDIDNTNNSVTENQVIELLASLNLQPFLLYRTFSYKPEKPRFRAVWVLSEPVGNADIWVKSTKRVISLIEKNFPGSMDRGAFDTARIWMPGGVGCVSYYSGMLTDIQRFEELPESRWEIQEQEEAARIAAKMEKKQQALNNPVKGDYEKIQADIEYKISTFPLCDYVRQITGTSGRKTGKTVLFPVCPCCHHNNCLSIKENEPVWHCYSSNHAEPNKGGAVRFFMSLYGLSFGAARDKLISEQLGYDPAEIRKMWGKERGSSKGRWSVYDR